MDDKILILINSIRRNLEAIATIYDELERHPLTTETGQDTLIIVAYHGYNLLTVSEKSAYNFVMVFTN